MPEPATVVPFPGNADHITIDNMPYRRTNRIHLGRAARAVRRTRHAGTALCLPGRWPRRVAADHPRASRRGVTRASRDYGLHHRENARALAAKPLRWRPAQRPCLHCRQPFLSSHAGNRICMSCHDEFRKTGAMAVPS